MKWKWPQVRLQTLLILMIPLAICLYDYVKSLRVPPPLIPSYERHCEFDLTYDLCEGLLGYRRNHGHFPINNINDFPHLIKPPPHSWRTRLKYYSVKFPGRSPQPLLYQ